MEKAPEHAALPAAARDVEALGRAAPTMTMTAPMTMTKWSLLHGLANLLTSSAIVPAVTTAAAAAAAVTASGWANTLKPWWAAHRAVIINVFQACVLWARIWYCG
jgi:hypothetical protein